MSERAGYCQQTGLHLPSAPLTITLDLPSVHQGNIKRFFISLMFTCFIMKFSAFCLFVNLIRMAELARYNMQKFNITFLVVLQHKKKLLWCSIANQYTGFAYVILGIMFENFYTVGCLPSIWQVQRAVKQFVIYAIISPHESFVVLRHLYVVQWCFFIWILFVSRRITAIDILHSTALNYCLNNWCSCDLVDFCTSNCTEWKHCENNAGTKGKIVFVFGMPANCAHSEVEAWPSPCSCDLIFNFLSCTCLYELENFCKQCYFHCIVLRCITLSCLSFTNKSSVYYRTVIPFWSCARARVSLLTLVLFNCSLW